MVQTTFKQHSFFSYDKSSTYEELEYRLLSNNEHSVMYYVKNLPYESALYPANMYHRFTEVNLEGERMDSVIGDLARRKEWEAPLSVDTPYITWNFPARDLKRPREKMCSFIRAEGTRGNEGLIFTACSEDRDHYAKAKRNHCWSLTCPNCCNDTALRMGTRTEEQLLSFRLLSEKQGIDPGQLGHWVISPIQNFAKSMIQDETNYNLLKNYVIKQLQENGSNGGTLVLHPWRQNEGLWKFSPHFHSLCFGRIDTDNFRRNNPGWIIKKVHANEEMESISLSMAYLATHMGLALIERPSKDIDFDLMFLAHMYPGLCDDYAKDAKNGTIYRYTDKDLEDNMQGKGRMNGGIMIEDWTEWTMKYLFKKNKQSYFGGPSRKNMRIVTVEKEQRARVCNCEGCGKPLNVYAGLCDTCGTLATYMFDNTVRTFRNDYDNVKQILDGIKKDLKQQGMSISDIATKTALMVSAEELSEVNGGCYRGNTKMCG